MANTELKTCQVPMHDGKVCGRLLYDGQKCICHSEREAKDIRLFQDELDKIFSDEKADCYDLSRFVFPKVGYDLPKEYTKDVYFRLVKFSRRANFGGVTFSKAAIFNGTDFSSGAKFRWVTFLEEAEFLGATFSGKVDFGGARFLKYVNFFHCKVQNGSTLIFDGGVLPTEEKGQVFTGGAGFVACFFADPENIFFRKLSLEKCRFFETDVSEIQFTDVAWVKKPKLLKWFPRNAVYDEVLIEDKWFKWLHSKIKKKEDETPEPQCNLIAQLYRRLQANYINNYRYAEAGDFYIGEQEMMRKGKGSGWTIWRRWVCTNFIYKLLSYYGESFLLPLVWLALLLLGFPVYLLREGTNIATYSQAFWTNLTFITFNRTAISTHLPLPYQQGIVAIENIVVIVLVTFFILALRRRYKRKGF
jgi:uncharacterized protein YjbI with pentapeptide repeats